MNINIIPNKQDYLEKQRENEESLSEIYPHERESDNPLPVYIISAHGICYQGVEIKRDAYHHSINPNHNTFPNNTYGNNLFIPPKDSYVLHSSVLGSAAVCSIDDDKFLKTLTSHGRKTRNNHMHEQNYVSFARQIFSRSTENIDNWIELNAQENIIQGKTELFNELIDEVVENMYNSMKSYNFRRKRQTIRKSKTKFKQSYYFPKSFNFENILTKKNERKLKICIQNGKRLLNKIRTHLTYESYVNYFIVFCELEDEIEISNIKFARKLKSKPLIGCPGIATMEKNFVFSDPTTKEGQNWYMGILEISKETLPYYEKYPEIKLYEKTTSIKNNTKAAQKDRIINNRHDVLSGRCLHSSKTKREWLTQKINYSIDNPVASQHLSLSEVMYQFGRGIYMCLNCTPLNIWNGIKTSFSKRKSPHYCLNVNNVSKSTREVICTHDYIQPILMPMQIYKSIDDYKIYTTIYQSEIYIEIFNILVKYNEKLYRYWPKNVSPLSKSTQFSKFVQQITPENYLCN